jgi:hypothetical protein
MTAGTLRKTIRLLQAKDVLYGFERCLQHYEPGPRPGEKTVTAARGWFVPCVALTSLNSESEEEKQTLQYCFEGGCGPMWERRTHGSVCVLVRSSDIGPNGTLVESAGLDQKQVDALGVASIVAQWPVRLNAITAIVQFKCSDRS